jgi:hypothetical protein
MMKKMVISFVLVLAAAFGCISIPQIEVGGLNLGYESWSARDYFNMSGGENLTLQQFDEYMTQNYNAMGQDYWGGLGLSIPEKQAIFDFLSHGYSVKKMTAEEYAVFLDNATKVNADMSTCAMYGAVAYREGFAGYVFSPDSEKTENCTGQARALCGGGVIVPFLNDLPSGQNGTGSNYSGMHQDYFGPDNTPWLIIAVIIFVVAIVPIFARKIFWK